MTALPTAVTPRLSDGTGAEVESMRSRARSIAWNASFVFGPPKRPQLRVERQRQLSRRAARRPTPSGGGRAANLVADRGARLRLAPVGGERHVQVLRPPASAAGKRTHPELAAGSRTTCPPGWRLTSVAWLQAVMTGIGGARRRRTAPWIGAGRIASAGCRQAEQEERGNRAVSTQWFPPAGREAKCIKTRHDNGF